MCKITNSLATETLTSFRSIDNAGMKSFSDKELGLLVMNSTSLLKEVETYTKAIKAELVNRNIETFYATDQEKKVSLSEGKKSLSYDTLAIGEAFKKANRTEDFFRIVKVQKGLIESSINKDDEILNAISASTDTVKGNSFIMVSKMTKKELQEQIGK